VTPNVKRRRSPDWVRAMDSHTLHRLAGRLLRDFRMSGITPRQDWLLGAALSELEYRRRVEPLLTERCSCFMCIGREWTPGSA